MPATKTETKAAPATRTSPLDLAGHARALFTQRVSGFTALDGLRACLCLWMVGFHTAFYQHYFIRDAEMGELVRQPAMRWVMLGFLPVDGFFVLTGFLIAYPLLAAHSKGKPLPDGGEGGDPVAAMWYRRFARMVPVYFVGLAVFVAANWNGQFPLDRLRSEFDIGCVEQFGLKDSWPSACEGGAWLSNVLFTNNLMPFGGCQGYTWSLALQFQFYILFPLLWVWLARRAAAGPDPSAARSALARWSAAGVLACIAWRVAGFRQMLAHDLLTIEGFFFGFFWYSFTLTRVSVLLLGVLLACVVVDGRAAAWMRSRRWAQDAGWALCVAVVVTQVAWTVVYDLDQPGYDVPGRPALLRAQEAPTALAAWHHLAFYALLLVGGPVSGLVFCYTVFMVVGEVGGVARALRRVWSLPVWYPVAQLSYWVYLLHPLVIVKLMAGPFFPPTTTVPGFFGSVLVVIGVTLALAAALHVAVERPVGALLRRTERLGPRGTRALRWYVYLCMVASALHHAVMLGVVLTAEPKESGDGAKAAAAAATAAADGV